MKNKDISSYDSNVVDKCNEYIVLIFSIKMHWADIYEKLID